MTKGDRVVLTPRGVNIFPDIGTREGELLFINGDIAVVRWTGKPGVTNLRREFIMPIEREATP